MYRIRSINFLFLSLRPKMFGRPAPDVQAMQHIAMISDPTLRVCEERDMAAVLGIYAPYVEEDLASFELELPSLEEMKTRGRAIVDRGFPYIVAELHGQIVGYAYAGLYRPRAAYRFTLETLSTSGPTVTAGG